MSVKSYEQITREWTEAEGRLRMFRAEFVAASEERDAEVREAKFAVEHRDAIDEVQALVVELNVARAVNENRWIAAHEDLAVLRQAGLPSSS